MRAAQQTPEAHQPPEKTGPGNRRLLLFRVLVTGTAVSAFGSYLNMVALNLFVFQATGSSVQTGAFMALRLAAGFVAGFAGGSLAARLPRRGVMVACDVLQALVLIVLAISPATVQLGLLPVVAVATGFLGTTSAVMLRSSVPDLVGSQDRIAANGLLVTGRAVAMALGFAASGVLVTWLGYRAAFLADAGTFVISATLIAVLPLAFPRGQHPVGEASFAEKKATSRMRTGVLIAAPAAAFLVLIRAVDAFGSASHNVGLPVFATMVRPAQPAIFLSQFFTVWAIGLIAAQQITKRLHHDETAETPGRSERLFVAGTCLMSLAFIAAFVEMPGHWVLAVAFIAGAADGFTEIAYTTRLQAEPEPRRGQLFGLTAMAENGGLGLGMLAAAGLLVLWQPLAVAAVMHGTVVLLAVVVIATRARRSRRSPRSLRDAGGRSFRDAGSSSSVRDAGGNSA